MRKALVCSVCGYIHLKENTPEKCPVCQATSKAFNLKEGALRTNEDVATTGESHKKHLPLITINNIDENTKEIKAKIGELEHPMMSEHYITNIMFYADEEYVGGIALTHNLKPEGSISINTKCKKISVIEHCNIHGDWITENNI